MKPPSTSSRTLIALNNVAKTYRTLDKSQIIALSPTSLSIADGEFVSIVGPSGCGKTTLLNLMTGLILPSEGEISFDGKTLDGPSPEMSLVFQRPVLLPWRSVLDNLLLPVEVLGLTPHQHYVDRARELLAMVGLSGFEKAYPRELSGGMQQRASIARALIYESRALLMDEPFAALDAMTRDEMNIELLRIWALTRRAVVFVTHNISEAVLLSQRVVVMTARPGKVRDIISVDLPQPRTLEMMGSPEFGVIANHIRGLMHPSNERGQGLSAAHVAS